MHFYAIIPICSRAKLRITFTHREKVALLFDHWPFSFFFFHQKCFFKIRFLDPCSRSLYFFVNRNLSQKCHFCSTWAILFNFFSSFIVQMSINIGGHNYWSSTVFIPLIISASSFYFFESWIYILSIWPILCELLIVKKWKIWSKAFLISPNSIN